MRRFLLSAVFIIFICTILILQFFGGAIRAALSPKVEVVRPQIYAATDPAQFSEGQRVEILEDAS